MQNLKTKFSYLIRAGRLLTAAGLLSVVFGIPVLADNVVQGFQSKDTLQPGLVVSLDSNSSKTVRIATASDKTEIYGVVVDPSDAPLTLNSQNLQVFVATSGSYQVLVSTASGSIKAGDYLSVSPINGIAAKATDAQPIVIGQAESAFNGQNGVITTSGNTAIGRVYVNIAVGKNPLTNTSQAVPYFLKKVANSVAGKPVSTLRIYAAVAIFIVASIAAITLLWSGVSNSLISLGRNPLSRHTIFSGMYKVILTGMGIFAVGLAGVYLLLKI